MHKMKCSVYYTSVMILFPPPVVIAVSSSIGNFFIKVQGSTTHEQCLSLRLTVKCDLLVLTYFSLCLVHYCKPWITPRNLYKVLLATLEVLPRSREKYEKVILLDMCHRWRSAAPVSHLIKVNESAWRPLWKKKICGHCRSYFSKCENLALFVKYLLILYEKCSFYVGTVLL